MPTLNLVAVDQVLTVVDAPDALEPYLLSMVFANAAARAQSAGSSSDDSRASSFYASWIQNLGQLGWTVREAHSSFVRTTTGAQQTTTLLTELCSRVSADAGSIPAATILGAAAQGAAGPAALYSFWWNQVTALGGVVVLALASLTGSAAAPALTAEVLVLDATQLRVHRGGKILGKDVPVDIGALSSLSATVLKNSVIITTHTLSALLDMQVFGPKQAELTQKLGDKARDHWMQWTGDEAAS